MRETHLNKGKKLDHQKILARISSEIGRDKQDFWNERKLFNKRAMKMCPGWMQVVMNESFPSKDCSCFKCNAVSGTRETVPVRVLVRGMEGQRATAHLNRHQCQGKPFWWMTVNHYRVKSEDRVLVAAVSMK